MRVRRASDAPFVDPIVAATMVDAGRRAGRARRPGVGRLPGRGRADRPRASTATPTSRRWWSARARARGDGGERGAPLGRRSLDAGRVARFGCRAERLARRRRCCARATALGVYDDGYVVVHERSRPVERLWHVRAARRGARDRRARAADRVRRQRPARRDARRRRADVTSTDSACCRASGRWCSPRTTAGTTRRSRCADAGVEIAAIVRRRRQAARRPTPHERDGIEVRRGGRSRGPRATAHVAAVHVVGPAGERDTIDADLVLGLRRMEPGGPALARDRRRPALRRAARCFVPDGTGPTWLTSVGAAAGEVPAVRAVLVRACRRLLAHFVDLQRDQTVADVLDAVAHGLRSVEHVKRATYIGTALDQGRASGRPRPPRS